MNEDNAYNLIDEPWIPVLMQDGTNHVVSLGEIFADESGTIADLTLNPYERIAIFRLLLCIAQAALPIAQINDERSWFSVQGEIGSLSLNYMEKWHDHFYLYGTNSFVQIDCLEAGETIPYTSRLLLNSAHHFGSPLFSRNIDTSGKTIYTPSLLAVALLSYLNFSASGGTPTCKWNGEKTNHIGAIASPCRGQSKLFTIVVGNSLLQTIWMNLLTEKQLKVSGLTLGRPCWEFKFNNCQCIEDEAHEWLGTILNASRNVSQPTWLGSLVPLSRFVKLNQDTCRCLICEGFKYPQATLWREPQATFVTDSAGIIRCLYVNPNREPWRDLSSILELRLSKGGPIALEHLSTLAEYNTKMQNFTIWTGGMYSKADRDQDMYVGEWYFTCPIFMLRKTSLDQYHRAVELATRQWFCHSSSRPDLGLKAATKDYATYMKIDKASRFFIPAERIYWDILAQPENQKLVQDINSRNYYTDWKAATRKAAEEAYRRVCPAVSARQMEAFAQGFSKLNIREA